MAYECAPLSEYIPLIQVLLLRKVASLFGIRIEYLFRNQLIGQIVVNLERKRFLGDLICNQTVRQILIFRQRIHNFRKPLHDLAVDRITVAAADRIMRRVFHHFCHSFRFAQGTNKL